MLILDLPVANAESAAKSGLASGVYYTCRTCKTPKLSSSFSKRAVKKNGLSSRCLDCDEKDRTAWLSEHSNYGQTSYQKHREKILARHKAKRIRRFFWMRTRALVARHGVNSVVATPAELAKLWKSQRGRCALSGRRLNKQNSELDHKVPVKQGGHGQVSNLRWVDADVNHAKNALSESDFISLCNEVAVHTALKAVEKG